MPQLTPPQLDNMKCGIKKNSLTCLLLNPMCLAQMPVITIFFSILKSLLPFDGLFTFCSCMRGNCNAQRLWRSEMIYIPWASYSLPPHLKWQILPKLSEVTLLQCLPGKNIQKFHHYRFPIQKIYTWESEILL